jgi:glycosyltransferase involved in cell wall biosynthesis
VRPTVCFVTYELAPITPGGCGSYVTRIIPHLAGHCRVVLLAAMPAHEVAEYRRRGLHDPHGTGENEVLCLDELVPTGSLDTANVFLRNTQRFADALQLLSRERRIDLVEMPEYAGIAYATLKLRRQHGRLLDLRLLVRAHGSLELIDHHEGYGDYALERRLVYAMERYVLRHAESLAMATRATLADYDRFYGLGRDALVCPPPPDGRAAPPADAAPDAAPAVLFVGKLQAVKGADVFVRAAVRWLERGAPADARLWLAGSDTWPAGESFRARLEALVPPALRERFEFLGHVSADELAARARRARFTVVPSRWESYCYVAREMLALGAPVVLSPIAAFEELRGLGGVALFDGSTEDLARVMAERWAAPATRPEPADESSAVDYGALYAELARAPLSPAPSPPPAPLGLFALEPRPDVPPHPRVVVADPPSVALHHALAEWLGRAGPPSLALVLPEWTGSADALVAAADFLAAHPEVAAVEFLPRRVVPWVLADPDRDALLLGETDDLGRRIFGLVPAALVLRRTPHAWDLAPGTPRQLLWQVTDRVARDGEIELAWPPATGGLPLDVADMPPAGAAPPRVTPQAERWAVGYLSGRTREQARVLADLAEPTYWLRRSWQILRDGGARGYLRKILEVTRRNLGRPPG